MKFHSPIYNLLHQEIKACADHLLEMSQDKEICHEQTAPHILSRLRELHQFSLKVKQDEHYHPLCELKTYLENTMLCCQDEHNQLLSMRLSEVISLLGSQNGEMSFQASVVRSLTRCFVHHFLEASKPGQPLFRKLTNLKKL